MQLRLESAFNTWHLLANKLRSKTCSWQRPVLRIVNLHWKTSHQLLASSQYLYLLNSLSESELDITISDSIGVSKSHCNLIPVFWYLIESYIPSPRQSLLAWWNPLLLASSSCTAHQSFEHATTPVALGSSFGLMAIALVETLIALGTSIQYWRKI